MSLGINKASNFTSNVKNGESKVDHGKASELAARIKEACDGWGTDEDAIFAALGEAADIPGMMLAVEREFNKMSTESFSSKINDELSGSDKDHAWRLYKSAKAEVIEKAPGLIDDPEMFAQKISGEIQYLNDLKMMLKNESMPDELKLEIINAFGTEEQIQETIETLGDYRTALQVDPDSIDLEDERKEVMAAISTVENALKDFEPVCQRLQPKMTLATDTSSTAGSGTYTFGPPTATLDFNPTATLNGEGTAAAEDPHAWVYDLLNGPNRDLGELSQRLGQNGFSYGERYELLKAALDPKGLLQRFESGDPKLLEAIADNPALMEQIKRDAKKQDAILAAMSEFQDLKDKRLSKRAQGWA